ncbi:MAG: PAS domain S-box protein [Ignavibacteriae bacterium]|nr:MAG: PAS domain S-box protein [Ignavibacteriota bacterium]
MQEITFDIWWALAFGTIALLVIAVGFVVAVMASKQKELITKKRQFEELAASERKFRNLFEHSPAGMLRITTPHWNVVDANQALLHMFRASTFDEVKEIIYTMSPAERKRLMAQLSAKGTVEDHETLLHRQDGSDLWVSFSASLSSRENHTEAVFVDITARRQAEETIREQAKLLDLTQDAIMVLDLQKRVRYWNKGAERLYGYLSHEVIDKNVMEFIYDENTAKDFRQAYEYTMQNAEWSGELRQIKRGGAVLNSDCRWTLVRSANGEPSGILQVCTDVTERKRMESRFLRAQRVESIGIFASGIVHDLNNVFSPMLIGVRVLKRKLHDQRSRRLIQNIESSARYGSEMARQVLSFVKGAQGVHTKLNPQKIIKDVYRQLEQVLPENIRVQIHVADTISSIMGDITQLRQVLVNLCTNARDAMPQGGELWVSAENTQVSKEMVEEYAGATEGEFVVFSVRDTGSGIPSSEVHKIFEPFYTTKEVGKGTGLGLSITIGIIKGHKGFITVESEKGKGSTFKIFLPAVSTVSTNPEQPDLQSGDSQTVIYIAHSEEEYNYKLFDDLEDSGYEPVLVVGRNQMQESLLQYRSTILAIIFDGFFPRETPELMKDVLKLEHPAKMIVLASKDQMEEIKADEELKPYAAVELPATIETVLEVLQKPIVQEVTLT